MYVSYTKFEALWNQPMKQFHQALDFPEFAIKNSMEKAEFVITWFIGLTWHNTPLSNLAQEISWLSFVSLEEGSLRN